MMIDKETEDEACAVLKAFVEEFGPSDILVSLPHAWYDPTYSLGPVGLQFTTVSTLEITVYFENNVIHRSFQTNAQEMAS